MIKFEKTDRLVFFLCENFSFSSKIRYFIFYQMNFGFLDLLSFNPLNQLIKRA